MAHVPAGIPDTDAARKKIESREVAKAKALDNTQYRLVSNPQSTYNNCQITFFVLPLGHNAWFIDETATSLAFFANKAHWRIIPTYSDDDETFKARGPYETLEQALVAMKLLAS